MRRPLRRIIALHGFLGSAADWDPLRAWLEPAEIEAVDLWALTAAAGEDEAWGSIGALLESELRARLSRGALATTIVLGYSFGARLALAVEALGAGSLPVSGVCLVSCNPGMPDGDSEARARRLADDEAWARRFETWPEDEIRRAWEAQPVLARAAGGEIERARQAWTLPAPRAVLAAAMRKFSLARQPDFRPRLARWATPLLWVTGEQDAKFGAIARDLREAGIPGRFEACPGAGHRAPWDNPERFAGILERWNVE